MSYEPPVLSRKLGFGDSKAPESNSRLQSRLSHGEKPGMYNAYLQYVNRLKPVIFRNRFTRSCVFVICVLHLSSEWSVEITAPL